MSTASSLIWYQQLVAGANPAGVIAVVVVVSALGISLGSVRARGISIGIAGVLFAGILYAHFFWKDDLVRDSLARTAGGPMNAESIGQAIESMRKVRTETLEFLRDFGLVLFVYSVGMQVGPNFFACLRAQGLRWNLLAIANVALGFFGAWLMFRAGHVHPAAVVGVLSGAVTNTPGLAAAQQALRGIPGLDPAQRNLPGIGYAVAYPFGVLGTILAMILVRIVFRIDVAEETKAAQASQNAPNQASTAHGLVKRMGVGLARFRSLFAPRVAPDFAEASTASEFSAFSREPEPWRGTVVDGHNTVSDDARYHSMTPTTKHFVVTHQQVVGKTLGELNFRGSYGVDIVRITRADIETAPRASHELHYGDTLVAIGDEVGLRDVEEIVGNSTKKLETPHLVPMLVVISVGLLIGSIPVSIAGLPAPVKIGLAGGPLLAALFFSSVGRIGPLSFYLPRSANLMLREFGIVLFLSAVGLMAGGQFVQTLQQGDGWYWMAAGAAITFVPLAIVAVIARTVLRVNYSFLCGILAGSMTDPPALAFANSMTQTDAPAIAYGTVYPVTMILRILSAQLFVILFTIIHH